MRQTMGTAAQVILKILTVQFPTPRYAKSVTVFNIALSSFQLAEIMPSKTAPETAAGSKRKRLARKVTVEDVEDEDDEQLSTRSNSSAPRGNDSNGGGSEAQPSSSTRKSRKVIHLLPIHGLYASNDHFLQAGGKRNPIYYFYEEITHGADGTRGSDGSKHYKCFHGNKRVLTITRAMRSSLNGV